jgi:hypothetical protein
MLNLSTPVFEIANQLFPPLVCQQGAYQLLGAGLIEINEDAVMEATC